MKRAEERTNNNLESSKYEKLVKSDNSENRQKNLRDMNEENIE